jgi:hypothetical protein
MFQWDEANLSHIAIHSVTRAEAEEVIYNSPLDLEVQSGISVRLIAVVFSL